MKEHYRGRARVCSICGALFGAPVRIADRPRLNPPFTCDVCEALMRKADAATVHVGMSHADVIRRHVRDA